MHASFAKPALAPNILSLLMCQSSCYSEVMMVMMQVVVIVLSIIPAHDEGGMFRASLVP